MKNGTRILAMTAMLAAAATAGADELARWNSSGVANPTAGSFPAQATASGVTATNLTTGTGLLLSGNSPAANTFSAGGYNMTNATTAMSGNDWWETCLDAGKNELALESLKYTFRTSGTGPKYAQWAWSTNRTAWNYLGTPEAIDDTYSVERTAVNLSGVPDASRVWLRMVAWGGGTANNAWGGFGKEDVIKIYGEVLSSDADPSVSFQPAAPWTYVANTLTVKVKARPSGAQVTSMAVSPTPKGSVKTNLTEGTWTWTFTPKPADAHKTFTLTAVVSKDYGGETKTATSNVDVRVKGAVVAGTMTIDFEDVTDGATDEQGSNQELPAGSGTNWVLQGAFVRAGDESDLKNGNAALVFTTNAVGSMASQGKLLPGGISKISFCYGMNSGEKPVVRTLVSEDGTFWVEADAADTAELGSGELAERSFDVGVGSPVYLMFRCDGFPGSGQVYLDDVVIQPISLSTYDAFLLKYNVTPGDPGTALGDDLDDDKFANGGLGTTEFSKDTNPYDPYDHP